MVTAVHIAMISPEFHSNTVKKMISLKKSRRLHKQDISKKIIDAEKKNREERVRKEIGISYLN